MTADRWARIHDLFEACLDQPPESRAYFLARQTVEPDVRAEVAKLLAQDHAAGDFLVESPDLVKELHASPRSQFAAGDRLGNRFELLRLIGRGGMGEVYAALDVDLEEQVAVKVLHADLLGDSAATQRFRRELQLARKVTHPNVCRLFDLGRHATATGDVFFLTMELVEGETLAQHLETAGRMSVEQAHPIVEQILNGLAAAHHAGIIHRDLKPSNVMLTPDRAVIMDFGLARRESGVSGSLTSSGKVMGTLDYMAPEQLQGAAVTERTDIYALGLLLYEMTTGVRPFGHGDSVAGALKRLTQTPPPPATLAPDLPRNWSRTIAAALELDPAHRPSGAREVLAHLQGSGPRRRLRLSRRHLIAAATIPAAGVSLYWGGSRLLSEGTLRIPESSLVMMANVTGSEKAATLTEVFRQQLAQSAHFNLLDTRTVAGIQQQMVRQPDQSGAYWREVAMRGGAKAIVYPTVAPVGDGFTVTVRAETTAADPSSPIDSRQQSFAATNENGLFSAIHDGVRWLRSAVGEDARGASYQDRAPETATTNSWEALRLFSAAEDAKRSDHRTDAVLSLQRAVDLDPDFALGHARLADILVNLHRYSEGFAHWKRAVGASGIRRLTVREGLRVQGMFALDAEDWPKAEVVWNEAVRLYPHDAVALFYLGDVKRRMGHHDEALELMQRSDRLQPDRLYTIDKLVLMNLTLQHVAAASMTAERARKIGHAGWAEGYLGTIAQFNGDPEKAIEHYRRMGGLPGQPEVGHRLLGRLFLDLNRATEAVAAFRDSIRSERSSRHTSGTQLDMAEALRQNRQSAEARAQAIESVRDDDSPETIARAGGLLAQLGLASEAQRLLDQMPKLEIPRFLRKAEEMRVEIAVARREWPAALSSAEAVERWSTPEEPRLLTARMLLKIGDRARAKILLEKARTRPVRYWTYDFASRPGLAQEAETLYREASGSPVPQ